MVGLESLAKSRNASPCRNGDGDGGAVAPASGRLPRRPAPAVPLTERTGPSLVARSQACRGHSSVPHCDLAHRRQREADPPPVLSLWLVPVCKPRPGSVGGGTLEIAVVLGRKLSGAQLSLAPISRAAAGEIFPRVAQGPPRGPADNAAGPERLRKPFTLFRKGP